MGNDLLQILMVLIDDEIKSRKNSIPPSSSNELRLEISKNKDDQTTEGNIGGLNRVNDESNRTHDKMIRTATKIIGHFARVGKATRPMALFPGFLR